MKALQIERPLHFRQIEIAEPLDAERLAEVQAIFQPVKNVGHAEGLAENN